MARLLNHVEAVYRPGDRALVGRLFELLGCAAVDTGGPFLIVHVDPEQRDPAMLDNCVYASEVTPAQLALEDAFIAALAEQEKLADGLAAYTDHNTSKPQFTTHFGLAMSIEALDAAIDRVEHVRETDPELADHVSVTGVFRPGEPGSLSPTLVQAFVQTDLCAAGLIALGQRFELQARVPAPGAAA